MIKNLNETINLNKYKNLIILRRNFSSDLIENKTYDSVDFLLSTNHPELFFFTNYFLEFILAKRDDVKEYYRQQDKLVHEIIHMIIYKIPESGRDKLAVEIIIHLYLTYGVYTPVHPTLRDDPELFAVVRYRMMIELFSELSLLVSQNHREIFFPDKNPEDIKKDIEKACSVVVILIKNINPNEIIPHMFLENFIPIIFSIWGDKSLLILNNTLGYFSRLNNASRENPHKEFYEMEIIMDMTRLIMKT